MKQEKIRMEMLREICLLFYKFLIRSRTLAIKQVTLRKTYNLLKTLRGACSSYHLFKAVAPYTPKTHGKITLRLSWQQNIESAILPVSNQIEDSEHGTSDKNPAHGSDIGKIHNKPLLKPKVACRTISQPLQTRSPPVPRVRTTVRRHRSELAAPGEGFVVELSDLWTSSTSITPGEAESKESEESKENKDSKESRENEESDPATPGLDDTYCNTAQLKGYQNDDRDRVDKDGTYVSPFKNNGDNELTPQADKTSSPLELKPKTRRISTTSDNNQDLILTKQIPPKPERKSSTSANSGGRSRKASRDEQSIGTSDARHNSNPDNDEESEVEYDKLPVRHKNIGSRKAFQSFVPSVPVKGVGSERVVYTPVNRSPVQRLRSTEKTEYAAPWEENIQALTPTLPPRQYKRSISDTAREDTTALESRHSFTSVDLNQEESIGDSHKVSLRKSVSLDYGLDNGPSHQRFSSISSEDQTEKWQRARCSETQESDGDDESVFHKDFANEVNHSPSSSLEEKTKSKKYQKSVKPEKAAKPEKPPKPAKFLKRQQLESMKRKISLPFLDDSFPEVLNPGLEGRALCRLLKVNEDETRVVEMIRPQTGPLGVFFTKGQEQNDEGLLVNAFQDSRNCKLFAGILGVGDQILEIDGCDIRHLSLDQVGEMMYDKERMIVRVMPASVASSVTHDLQLCDFVTMIFSSVTL
ncbi:hypothetical protein EGW08_005154 [Elysia chlorotica]|uniref:PDZ domain-containing protein n=1 Tax=Elysia chlorotica TaxID=188477 RepID=A0A433U014_ELYCH|nr:hypothetical protein EGW08_005154 [Elysia chlorotica]